MRCKACKGEVVAVDLMPRIIAITGEPGTDKDGFDNWDFAPELRDEDLYEASTTVGFGCNDSDCPNWHGNIGNVSHDEGVPFITAASNSLEDVAEEGKPN